MKAGCTVAPNSAIDKKAASLLTKIRIIIKIDVFMKEI